MRVGISWELPQLKFMRKRHQNKEGRPTLAWKLLSECGWELRVNPNVLLQGKSARRANEGNPRKKYMGSRESEKG